MIIYTFDLETFGLNANNGLLLCCVIKEYGKKKTIIYRADNYKSWRNNRTNQKELVKDIVECLVDADIIIGHNGLMFDRKFLVALCLKYNIDPVVLKSIKLIDPVQLSRKHLKMGSNALAYLIEFLNVKHAKTTIKWEEWMLSAFEGNNKSMNYIVEHCKKDVLALEAVYDKVKRLIEKVDSKGSSW